MNSKEIPAQVKNLLGVALLAGFIAIPAQVAIADHLRNPKFVNEKVRLHDTPWSLATRAVDEAGADPADQSIDSEVGQIIHDYGQSPTAGTVVRVKVP